MTDVNITDSDIITIEFNGIVVDSVLPDNVALLDATQTFTGTNTFGIDGMIQLLMTDDIDNPTYFFATSDDDGVIANDTIVDIRLTSTVNNNGYTSTVDKLTGVQETVIFSKTARVETSYDAGSGDSTASVTANGKGLVVVDTVTGTTTELTTDYGFTVNGETVVTAGSTSKTTLEDTDVSSLFDGIFKSFTWLNAYNYIKAKLKDAGFINLISDTRANILANYPYADNIGKTAFATDIGTGSMLIATATRWALEGGEAYLAYSALSLIIPPSFGAVVNGATTLLAAAGAYPKGFFYVAANSIHTTDQPNAGFYYGEMSSATGITFYNNTYTPAHGVYATEPATKIPFVGAGAGGVGVTDEITSRTVTVQANILGDYGFLTGIYFVSGNAIGTKTHRVRFGGSIASSIGLTTNLTANCIINIKNNTHGTQICAPSLGNNVMTPAPTILAVDTSAAATLSLTMQMSTALSCASMCSNNIQVVDGIL